MSWINMLSSYDQWYELFTSPRYFFFSVSRSFRKLKQNTHSLLRFIWLYIYWPKIFLYILNQIDWECMLKCEILKTALKSKIYAGRAVQSVQSTTGLNLFMEDYYAWYCTVFRFAHKQLRNRWYIVQKQMPLVIL